MWQLTGRWVDTKIDRPRWRFNLQYRATPRLSLQMEFNPAVQEFFPGANWTVLIETDHQPLVNFGTSSDRIFTPEGNRAYFVTIAKTIPGTRVAPYVGMSYSEFEKGFLFPAGANIQLSENWTVMPMFDGVNGHFLATYSGADWNLTGMLLQGKRFGLSFGFAF
ncbi:hypothetical protein QPK87_13660 [Kamptonema cortianum]|nr:hypothetical protein [Geitlerinema splendidum]MDK3157614.1 hypothetical protein [Kamptonema cortianum]